MEQLDNAVEASDIMEELGYNCTVGAAQCKEFLSFFSVLNEDSIARIMAMVARTHTGLEDGHGSYGTFFGAFSGSAPVDGLWATNTWNIEILVDAIKDAVRFKKLKSRPLLLINSGKNRAHEVKKWCILTICRLLEQIGDWL